MTRPAYHPRMRRVEFTLDVPEVAGAGAGQDCGAIVDKWVEVTGAYTGEVMVQGQMFSGGPWYDVQSAVGGTDTLIQVTPLFNAVCVDTTGVISGTPVVRMAGLDRRTE